MQCINVDIMLLFINNHIMEENLSFLERFDFELSKKFSLPIEELSDFFIFFTIAKDIKRQTLNLNISPLQIR